MKTHTVINVGLDNTSTIPVYRCTTCNDWQTRSLTDVARHVVENQYIVERKVKPKASIHN